MESNPSKKKKKRKEPSNDLLEFMERRKCQRLSTRVRLLRNNCYQIKGLSGSKTIELTYFNYSQRLNTKKLNQGIILLFLKNEGQVLPILLKSIHSISVLFVRNNINNSVLFRKSALIWMNQSWPQ